jgi:hypothetical protein
MTAQEIVAGSYDAWQDRGEVPPARDDWESGTCQMY